MTPALHTAVEVAIIAATVFAFFATASFGLAYHYLYRWQGSHLGRSMMTVTVGTWLLACAALVKRFDELTPETDWWPWLRVFVAVGWAVVGAVYLWRVVSILKSHDHDHEGQP